jgi:hypothetical protein
MLKSIMKKITINRININYIKKYNNYKEYKIWEIKKYIILAIIKLII